MYLKGIVSLANNNEKHIFKFHVVGTGQMPLISAETCKMLGLVSIKVKLCCINEYYIITNNHLLENN